MIRKSIPCTDDLNPFAQPDRKGGLPPERNFRLSALRIGR